MTLFDRISVAKIIKRHFETFYDSGYYLIHGKRKVAIEDKIVFIILPSAISILMIFLGLYMSNDYLNITLTCLSIFTGLLFGLLPLVFDLLKGLNEKTNSFNTNESTSDSLQKELGLHKIKLQVSKELFINICFEILISVAAIIFSLLTGLKIDFLTLYFKTKIYYPLLKQAYLSVTNLCAYFLLSLFIVTILMILKRFYLLFESETAC